MANTDILDVAGGTDKSRFATHVAKIQSTANFLNANRNAQASSEILSVFGEGGISTCVVLQLVCLYVVCG